MLSDADLTGGCKLKLPAIFNLAKKSFNGQQFPYFFLHTSEPSSSELYIEPLFLNILYLSKSCMNTFCERLVRDQKLKFLNAS